MDPNQNNANSPLPEMPAVPQINPQVISPQTGAAPTEQAAPTATPQAAQFFNAPQPQVVGAQPVATTPMSSTSQQFTSNPFLSFGKGLGSGLFYSPGTIIGAGAVIVLLFFAIAIAGGLVSGLLAGVSPLLGFIATLVFLLVGVVIAEQIFARTIIAFEKGGRSESISFKETAALVNFKTGLSLLGLSIISGIIITIGFILLIIPGLILLARLSLAPFVLVIEKKSIVESLSRSWSLTKHHTWDMLGANIVQYIGGSGSMLLLPAVYASSANRYSELTNLEQQGFTDKTKTHWSNYVVTILVFLGVGLYFLLIASTLSTANNAANKLNNSSTKNTGSSSSSTSNSFSSGKYCYYDGDISNSSAEFKCTDNKSECLANSYCKSDNSYQLN